ncbi:hypothetical protein RBB75_12590 [Tunturibacter empetritectus]|uniref:Uncharacterized protein n=1 Tax=Tunturiibacter empetritectus TaxID=3069691 RepID=A0AAU7Z8W4_9BACT
MSKDYFRPGCGWLFVLIVCCVTALHAQDEGLWRDFRFDDLHAKTNAARLGKSQINSIWRLLREQIKNDTCTPEDTQAVLKGLTFDEVPLKENSHVVRATAGIGCERGGQGANGGMWLFQVEGGKVQFLGGLSGWGMAVQRAEISGFHDFVTGWHMSGRETGLSYYRFDGKVYKSIGGTSAFGDDNGVWRLETQEKSTPK